MSHSTLSDLSSQWFAENSRLAYWMARRWAQRLLDYSGRAYSANDIEATQGHVM